MSNVSSNPSTNVSSSDSTQRISLAGDRDPAAVFSSNHHNLVSALDDVVDTFQQVAGSQPAGESSGSRHAAELLSLIETMSRDSCRRQAAQRLADFLADQVGGRSVRCGLGRGRLTQLYDTRLGWLGTESSLFQQAANAWDAPLRRTDDLSTNTSVDRSNDLASDSANDLANDLANDSASDLANDSASDSADDLANDTTLEPGRWTVRDGNLEITLSQPDGTAKCRIWVESELATSLHWFRSATAVLTAVLWSRPKYAWPSVTLRIARHTWISLVIAGVLLGILAIWPVHYRVACTARVETSRQRLVATPFEATLLTTAVKPGDTVSAGQVLVVLDGRPLRLEREAIDAELQQVSKEHDVALATRRIAEAQQAKLKMQQLSRQRELLTDRLNRLEVTSPIDGVVVSGDLEKYVGSPLERGQTLIEVAPMDRMIVEIEIPEYEIGYVRQGADVRVKLDAIGGESIRLPLDEVFPSAEIRDDRNVFVGRIEVDNQEGDLRPGMRGEATAYGPLRPWIWSWIRGGYERVLWWSGY